MNKPEAVIFDLGGVLIHWDPVPVFRAHFEGDEDAMWQFFRQDFSAMHWQAHDMVEPWEEGLSALARSRPDLKGPIEAYIQGWQSFLVGPIVHTRDLLHKLHDRGVGLYALTNWPAQAWPPVGSSPEQGHYEFLDLFRDIVVSGVEQMRKPDPAFYELALQRWGLEAADCLFVDDLNENIEAARGLGMQAHHFTPPNEGAKEFEQTLVQLGLL